MNSSSRELVEIFEYLPENDQNTLYEFAQFLKSRAPAPISKITEPLGLPRPDKESVVAAIKRLKKNYPMIPKKDLLNSTSELMMQHMMQGKAAKDVVDDLEVLFKNYFTNMMSNTE